MTPLHDLLAQLLAEGYDVRFHQPFSGTVAVAASKTVDGQRFTNQRAWSARMPTEYWPLEVAEAVRQVREATS